MKKFVIKGLLLMVLAVSSAVGIGTTYHGVGDSKASFMAAIIDKHQRCREVAGPAIFLVGGSNLAFGIDSDSLGRETGLPVVNLGLHAGLGLDFMLREALDVTRKGDIVILSTEYFLDPYGQFDLLYYTSGIFPDAGKYYKTNAWQFLKLYLSNYQKKVNQVFEVSFTRGPAAPEYMRNAFDKRGDLTLHLDKPHKPELKNRFSFTPKPYKGIRLMNDFEREAAKKGVKVYFIFPCCPVTDYSRNKTAIDDYYKQMKEGLDFPVLGTPADFVFSDTLFYDTVYHLLRKGRSLRTARVIQLIEPEIKNEKNTP